MIDIYRSRRGYNYKFTYWTRKENGIMDNEQLIHNNQPNGQFYAKIISSKAKDTNDIAGVFRVGTEGVTIETNDKVMNLDKDDLVKFNNQIWLVGRVNTEAIQKNSEFGQKISYKTTIELNRGE